MSAFAILALILGFAVTALGSIGAAVVLVTSDDRNIQKAATAVTSFSLAGFVAVVSLLPALVLQ